MGEIPREPDGSLSDICMMYMMYVSMFYILYFLCLSSQGLLRVIKNPLFFFL